MENVCGDCPETVQETLSAGNLAGKNSMGSIKMKPRKQNFSIQLPLVMIYQGIHSDSTFALAMIVISVGSFKMLSFTLQLDTHFIVCIFEYQPRPGF